MMTITTITTTITRRVLIPLIALLLTIAPVPLLAQAATQAEIATLIDEAEALRQQAAELEFEWRYTKGRIKDARAALAEGNLAEAEKHAARAKREAQLAIEQAATAEKVWEIAVPK